MTNLLLSVAVVISACAAVAVAEAGSARSLAHAIPDGPASRSSNVSGVSTHAPKTSTWPPLYQEKCPVTGKPVDLKYHLVYKGEILFFSSRECIATFKAGPRKYLTALYGELYPQRYQVKCPVTGGAVDPKVFVEYEGRRIYYCCPGCDRKLKADPDRYLSNLDRLMSEQVHCPVSGLPIDPGQRPAQTRTFQGKSVYLCCKSCIPKFEADPQKYTAGLLPSAGLLAHGPTAQEDLLLCAVHPSEGPHLRSEGHTFVYEGRRYFMHDVSCKKRFEKSPDTYARSLEPGTEKLNNKVDPGVAVQE